MQNDFCLSDGALYVPGAEKDVKRTCDFIRNNSQMIDNIILTADTHSVMDISHSCYWVDKDGNQPKEFTQISVQDVEQGDWLPITSSKNAKEYLDALHKQNEFSHTIWPVHCIADSPGAEVVEELSDALSQWSTPDRDYLIVEKGTNPNTEHFGVLRANVELNQYPETQLNTELLDEIEKYENVILVGEAKSHCVANSVKQIFDHSTSVKQIVVLDDCMSNVPGFESVADVIYNTAIDRGLVMTNSIEFNLD